MARVVTASSQTVSEAVVALSAARIVVIPTSRWFMVCCKASAPECIAQIFAAKKRTPSKQPLFVLPCKDRAAEYFRIGAGAQRLIDKLWPGELALLLPWREPSLAGLFRGFDRSAALAFSPPGLFGQIVSAAGIPLAATTVNVSESAEPSSPGPAISLQEVSLFLERSQLDVDLVIDSGICPAFMPTTIVDCRCPEGSPWIVREGYVHARAVAAALSAET